MKPLDTGGLMNKKFRDNDHELLHLIREHNDEAMVEMMTKYEPLILSKINSYHFPLSQKEDYLQEGRLVLLKAIENYQESYQKTFTRYFELLLVNRFNTLYNVLKKEKEQVLLGDQEVVDATPTNKSNISLGEIDDILNKSHLSSFERQVYEYLIVQDHSVKEACSYFRVERKVIYNTIQRIKKKVNKQNK